MNILIIGCGRWGSGLAKRLEQGHHDITVVDHEASSFARLDRSFRGRTIQGVEFDRDVLIAAGIERADGLAAMTPSDETNFIVARIAREEFRVPHVVARIYDPHKAEIYRKLGLNAVTPAVWGINRVSELICAWQLDRVASLGNGEVDIMERDASEILVNRSVNDITLPGELHVIAISRQGKTFLPTLGTRFQPGDRLHLAILATSSERAKAILGME